jgi:hypothetical protein
MDREEELPNTRRWWAVIAEKALATGQLSPWERDFCTTIASYVGCPTPRQQEVLDRLKRRGETAVPQPQPQPKASAVPMRRRTPIPPSLTQVERQLEEWGIRSTMWSTARSRGMTAPDFEELYRGFVAHHLDKRNRAGEVTLGSESRARFWAFAWLRDHGCPSFAHLVKHDPSWRDPGARTRSGKPLGWSVFTNPDFEPNAVGDGAA